MCTEKVYRRDGIGKVCAQKTEEGLHCREVWMELLVIVVKSMSFSYDLGATIQPLILKGRRL